MIETEEKALSLEGRQWKKIKKKRRVFCIIEPRRKHPSILDERFNASGNDPLRKLATELEALKRWELQVPPVPPATKPVEIPWNCRWNQVERETCKYLKQNNEIKAIWCNMAMRPFIRCISRSRYEKIFGCLDLLILCAGRVHPWGQVAVGSMWNLQIAGGRRQVLRLWPSETDHQGVEACKKCAWASWHQETWVYKYCLEVLLSCRDFRQLNPFIHIK